MQVHDLIRHRAEFARALRNYNFERTTDGRVLFPRQGLFIAGVFSARVDGGPRDVFPNTFVNEGLDDVLQVYFHGTSQRTGFFIAPFSNNVTPAAGLTAATFAATQGEFTNYTESTRVAWVEAAASGQSISNSASPARFTIGTGGGTVWGAGMLSASAKSATTGVLPAAGKFGDEALTLTAGSKLDVEYAIDAQDA